MPLTLEYFAITVCDPAHLVIPMVYESENTQKKKKCNMEHGMQGLG